MAFTQRTYNYILKEDTTNLKTVLDSGIPKVILEHLLAFALRHSKIESIRVLLCYCANIDAFYQLNRFYLKNHGNYWIRKLIDEHYHSTKE